MSEQISGDGWIDCLCGNRHWGKFGAAGLLAYRDLGQGLEILLQHRAPWSHNGDTWGLPGGALNWSESAVDGAMREAFEEVGIDRSRLHPCANFIDDHGSWQYETIIALAEQSAEPTALNDESVAVKWVALNLVEQYPLHPSFAKSWPALREVLIQLPNS